MLGTIDKRFLKLTAEVKNICRDPDIRSLFIQSISGTIYCNIFFTKPLYQTGTSPRLKIQINPPLHFL
jgi:hypothetical protein